MNTLHYGAIAASLIAVAAGMAKAHSADDAFGIWRHPENGSHVEMYKCGPGLCGKVVKAADSQAADDQAVDSAKRADPAVGMQIISNARKTAAAQWRGALYNRADGDPYSGTLTVKTKDTLDLQGCTKGAFCKTLTWTRVK